MFAAFFWESTVAELSMGHYSTMALYFLASGVWRFAITLVCCLSSGPQITFGVLFTYYLFRVGALLPSN